MEEDASAALPPRRTAVPVDGAPFDAELIEMTESGRIVLGVATGDRMLSIDDLIRWGDVPPAAEGVRILTAGGDLLVARSVSYESGTLKLESSWSNELVLPRNVVSGVIFHPPLAACDDDALMAAVRDARAESDIVLLMNGDAVSGEVQSIAGERIAIHQLLGFMELSQGRVVAWIAGRGPTRNLRRAGERTLVGLDGGSLFAAEQVCIDGGGFRAVLAGGIEIDSRQPGKIVFLQVLGRRATYLSELEPSLFEMNPFLSIDWPWTRDANVAGGRLRAGGRLHAKGLGMYPTSRLAFALPGALRRFEAAAAIDDRAGEGGSVVFRVLLVRGVEQREVFHSGVVRGGGQPVPVSVDLAGANTLVLVVEAADRTDVLDYANWLDARFVR
jgi:hypothetical protein